MPLKLDWADSHIVNKCEHFQRQKKGQTPSISYGILLPATAIIGYGIGLQKLLANQQFFFVGDQIAVRL